MEPRICTTVPVACPFGLTKLIRAVSSWLVSRFNRRMARQATGEDPPQSSWPDVHAVTADTLSLQQFWFGRSSKDVADRLLATC